MKTGILVATKVNKKLTINQLRLLLANPLFVQTIPLSLIVAFQMKVQVMTVDQQVLHLQIFEISLNWMNHSILLVPLLALFTIPIARPHLHLPPMCGLRTLLTPSIAKSKAPGKYLRVMTTIFVSGATMAKWRPPWTTLGMSSKMLMTAQVRFQIVVVTKIGLLPIAQEPLLRFFLLLLLALWMIFFQIVTPRIAQ